MAGGCTIMYFSFSFPLLGLAVLAVLMTWVLASVARYVQRKRSERKHASPVEILAQDFQQERENLQGLGEAYLRSRWTRH